MFPTSPWLDDDEVLAALRESPVNVVRLRAAVVAAYRRLTGSTASGELTQSEAAEAAAWLRKAGATPGLELLAPGIGAQQRAPLTFGFFADLSAKINSLGQRQCRVCPEAPGDLPSFWSHLRLPPESRQMISGAHLEVLRRRLSDHYGARYAALFAEDLCVALTFVLARRRRERIDLDNLAKTTLDSLRGTLYADDAQIQHLDLMKIRTEQDTDEWVVLNARPTALTRHADVFSRDLSHRWGVDPI